MAIAVGSFVRLRARDAAGLDLPPDGNTINANSACIVSSIRVNERGTLCTIGREAGRTVVGEYWIGDLFETTEPPTSAPPEDSLRAAGVWTANPNDPQDLKMFLIWASRTPNARRV